MNATATAIESDSFLVSQCADLMALEDQRDKLYEVMRANPESVEARLAYDIAVKRWAHAHNAFSRALNTVLGL